MNKKKTSSTSGNNSVRIVGGSNRGRKIPVADITGLRPTGDRLRETLFNWLAPYIEGSRVLDAYAGSGALAFEALSRGASQALLLDNSALAADQLKKSAEILSAKAEIRCQDALQFFRSTVDSQFKPFNIVFLDPPFGNSLLQDSVKALTQSYLLSSGALIYLENEKALAPISTASNWKLLREKTQGEVCCQLYQLCSG
jgi:16S rRNA (guanine966-N2)-methyltransferase